MSRRNQGDKPLPPLPPLPENVPEVAGPARAEAPAAPDHPEARVPLPSSGLADEILAELERLSPEAAAQAAEGPATPAALSRPAAAGAPATSAPAIRGSDRIFAFADTLEAAALQTRRQEEVEERPESWVTFELASEVYALPVTRVQEIQRAAAITRVPHAPTPVRGITNLRGRVLAVVDLRVRLGLPPAPLSPLSRILVVSSRERSLGLLVDCARQVIKLVASAIEPPPADVMTASSNFIRGVVHLGEALVIVLDIDRVLLVPGELESPFSPATEIVEAPGPQSGPEERPR